MQPIEYIDILRKERDWTDYRVCKELGIHRNQISEIRAGRSKSFGDTTAIKIADLLGLDRVKVVADMHAAKETEPTAVEFWKKLSGAAVIIFCLTFPPQHAEADSINGSLTNGLAIHYAHKWLNIAAIARKLYRSMARFMRNVLFDSLMESTAVNNG